MLARCLASIAYGAPGSTLAYEVLIVLNGADKAVVDFATRQVKGARLLKSDVNLGFGGGNNWAAREARGELLLLLNDDVEVEAGWLDPLVQTLERHKRAAAVGSRILFPDGRVQEAGSVLFSDGTTAPVGRGLPAGSTEYGFLRRVDYCSANSLLIRRSAFEEVGGFDPEYYPAYYEDTDLALALRRAGYWVLYDGRSRIRHLESASTSTHFKHFLFRRNLVRLKEKWADELAGQLPRPAGGGPDGPVPATLRPAIARAAGDRARLLVIDDMLPVPAFGAGFVLMHNMAVETGLDRYALTVHATKHPGADPMSVAQLGFEVVEGDVHAHLADPDARYDVVVLCRPDNFSRHIGDVRRLQPQAAVVYVAEALFAVRLEREAALQTDEREASRLRKQAEKMWVIEERAARESDHVVCVSPDEADRLRGLPGAAPVDLVVPLQADVPLTPDGLDDRSDMLYVAGWTPGSDSPNGDGFRWFVGKVLPLIADAAPWSRFRVTGANPPPDLYAMRSPFVEFTGFVPDLQAVYEKARVVVVPLRYGAGVKNKTVEALQYGVPVVTTTIGAEGIAVPPGLEPMIIADDPAELASAAFRLLTDREEWRRRRADVEALRNHWAAHRGTSWMDVIDAAMGARRAATREN